MIEGRVELRVAELMEQKEKEVRLKYGLQFKADKERMEKRLSDAFSRDREQLLKDVRNQKVILSQEKAQ